MHKKQVLAYFGGTSKTAHILGISHSAVCQWTSVVPEKQALKIERLTNGKLKYNSALYQHSSTEKLD
ncbi:Cro/CI family transcriptional regulator [Morganella morganii]|uniref:Cro/CI family transcriptional regulator n=1 Tax=Morganella morganii TaxID=582 RepID=UPI00277BC6EF|nr:helix-turn-helix domain-containing protein [Morganella morganii]HCT3118306.1 helix-turn-helix domain-containing protein [Morganella morganii]HDS3815959.1 helix-turn-helix domain-containing protein [Morganella morganii subsp. morganii]HDS5616837.1 helix-turn-helix domain-containing protein [Morganella morganii subsp. morganii]